MQTEHYMANMGSPAAREERSPQVPDDSAGPDRRAVATVLERGDHPTPKGGAEEPGDPT